MSGFGPPNRTVYSALAHLMETAKTRLFEIRFRKIIVSKEKGAQKVVKKGGERGERGAREKFFRGRPPPPTRTAPLPG